MQPCSATSTKTESWTLDNSSESRGVRPRSRTGQEWTHRRRSDAWTWVPFSRPDDNSHSLRRYPNGSVVAINQADASNVSSASLCELPLSAVRVKLVTFAAVSVDPLRNRIFALDGLAGRIAALELASDHALCIQSGHGSAAPLSEFLALIGSAQCRVLVGTDVPIDQVPGSNTNDWVVWRNAETGEEIARSPLLQVDQ